MSKLLCQCMQNQRKRTYRNSSWHYRLNFRNTVSTFSFPSPCSSLEFQLIFVIILALVRRTFHSAEIFIHEPSLNRSLFPSNLNSQRLDMLYACLVSAKSLLDNIFALPLSSYYGFSIITLSQLGYGLSTAFKLFFIEVPGWDLTYVRSTVNLLQYFEHFIAKFEQAGAQIDNTQPTPTRISFCTGCSRAMGRVKGWYEVRLAAETEEKQREQQTGLTGIDDILGAENFNYWDEAFFKGDWEEIMGDFMQQ
jgi:hypothetical protein